MLSLLFVLLLTIAHSREEFSEPESDLECASGSYHYQGVYHSDSYFPIRPEGQSACSERKNFDAVSMEQSWKDNQALIKTQIDDMLNDQTCSPIHDVLKKYLEAVKAQLERYKARQLNRMQWMDKNAPDLDLQRTFAWMQAWNSLCSAQQSRSNNFIDLEAINRIMPANPASTRIQEDGQIAENCQEVKAFGSDNLKNFKVSLGKAQGEKFNFSYDVYGIPDRVILKSGGRILHDSGCESTTGPVRKEFLLKSVGKFIEVDIIHNCKNPGKSGSAWELEINCEQKDEKDPCLPKKEKLAALLKNQVQNTKSFMDMNHAELGCMSHLDENVIPELLKNGLIKLEEGPRVNTICDLFSSELCEEERFKKLKREGAFLPGESQSSDLRGPAQISTTENKESCPARPSYAESIFNHISWAYCKHAPHRLNFHHDQ